MHLRSIVDQIYFLEVEPDANKNVVILILESFGSLFWKNFYGFLSDEYWLSPEIFT